MSAAGQCKDAGLKSLVELSEISGVPVSTLKDWRLSRSMLFDLMIHGVVFKQSIERMKKCG